MPSENVKNFGRVEITAAGSTTLTQDAHAGMLVVSNLAAAQTFVLPAATGSGNVYRIFVETTKTGALVIDLNGTDVMNGGVSVATDAAGVSIPTAAGTVQLSMNGSTTGGVQGSHVTLTDAVTGVWMVDGFLVSTSTEATPFS